MNKTEMKKDMSSRLGDKMFISRSTLVQITGFGTAFVDNLVSDLEYIEIGKVKKYYTGDVVDKLKGVATR